MIHAQPFRRLFTLTTLLGLTMLLIGHPAMVDAQSENPNAYGSAAGSPNHSVYVDASGNVGIGMTSSQARLDLANGPTWRSGWKRTIRMGAANLIEFVSKDISFGVGGDNSGNLVFFAADGNSNGPTTGSMALDKNGNLNITGNMGLGVISPQARLDLASGPTWRSGWKRTIRMGAANLIEFISKDTSFGIGGDNSGNLVFFAADGNSSGPTTGSMALNKNGNLNVSGTTTTSVLQITGGADLAEPFCYQRHNRS
ncbi:MAG: hypothetical protein R2867_01990 [Caldilineaceae bacterium]